MDQWRQQLLGKISGENWDWRWERYDIREEGTAFSCGQVTMGHGADWDSHLKSPQAPGSSRESVHLKTTFPAVAEEWLLK